MSKKVLVFGASGQDGSLLIDYLLENTEHDVYGIVRRVAKPDHSNLSKAVLNPRFQLVMGDLSDSHSIDNLVRNIKPDYFVNLAAQSFVAASWEVPEQTFDVDATGVLRCLEAVRKHVPECRFYSAGSTEQWGDVQYSPQDENHPFRARSPYAAAKIAAHHLVKVYRESYNLFAIQCILANHEGNRRGAEFLTQKVAQGVARIKKSMDLGNDFCPLELGNLNAKRDWSNARDVIRGVWAALNRDEPVEYVFSSNETHSVREFVELSFGVVGIKGEWKNPSGVPEDETYEFEGKTLVKINPKFYRPAEVDLLWGDSTKARTELGWLPEYSFQDLVKEMVDSAMNS